MFDYETIRVQTEGAACRVDFNRPRKANCLDATMWKELKDVFFRLDSQPEVRAVVLGGQGRFFCAGIDLEYLLSVQQEINPLPDGRKQEYLRNFIADLQASVNAIEQCRKPVLAAIQGACIGGGVDMRYATADTRFSVKEVDLAIVADLGTLQRLPGIVGQGVARELAFTGRDFDGAEALAMGFVNKIFPTRKTLAGGTMEIAQGLAAKSPLTLRGIKETMNHSRDHSVAQGLNYIATRNAGMLLSKDLQEAVTAYLEKRPARFDD